MISPASVLRLRSAAMRRLRRVVGVAIVAWIALVVAGREHALQAIGVEIACVHPGSADPVHGADDDHAAPPGDEHGRAARPAHAAERSVDVDVADAPDADEGDDCPIGCSGCACGAAPFAMPTVTAIASRTWRDAPFVLGSGSVGPRRTPTELDRPPRRRA